MLLLSDINKAAPGIGEFAGQARSVTGDDQGERKGSADAFGRCNTGHERRDRGMCSDLGKREVQCRPRHEPVTGRQRLKALGERGGELKCLDRARWQCGQCEGNQRLGHGCVLTAVQPLNQPVSSFTASAAPCSAPRSKP
ncbi:hypothetical protein YWIDRAFT_01618 [Streptomyces sp. SceaMP-e96]|nr:hypothetical protein YWIDRAFT_01618 [Streptomyces sp. SceaMP-e96]